MSERWVGMSDNVSVHTGLPGLQRFSQFCRNNVQLHTHTLLLLLLLLRELLELLSSDDATGIVDRADARETSASGKGVLTNDELELLLDRSELTWRTQKEQLASKKRKKIDVEPKTGLCFTVVDDETKDSGDWVGSVN